MLKMLKLSMAVLLSIALASCGFSLRGSASLPEGLRTMQFASVDNNSEMAREMQRALRNNKVTVVATTDNSVPRLGVGNERSTEKTLSVNSNARTGEYELNLSVPYQLSLAGKLLAGPDSVTVSRVYLADPDNAVAKSEEAAIIRQEMRRELALLILRRLENVEL